MNADSCYLIENLGFLGPLGLGVYFMESGLTEAVIGAAFEVSNTLGTGFFEKVYERALVRELKEQGVRVDSQVPFSVIYGWRELTDLE